jgi:hypothetical protein
MNKTIAELVKIDKCYNDLLEHIEKLYIAKAKLAKIDAQRSLRNWKDDMDVLIMDCSYCDSLPENNQERTEMIKVANKMLKEEIKHHLQKIARRGFALCTHYRVNHDKDHMSSAIQYVRGCNFL